MTGRRILITGGCGFVGVNLVRRMLGSSELRAKLVVLDNETMGTEADLPDGDIEFLRGDVRDLSALTQSSKGCDTIVHLAAHTGVIDSIEDPFTNFEVNARGTLNVLMAARASEVGRVVIASTGGAILGDVPPPVHEEMLPKPQSPYGASKLAGEGYAEAFGGAYGLQVTTLRFSNVYGPYSRRKGSAIAHFFRQILSHKAITIYGDGSQVRDFVFVEDVCDGILQAIDADMSGVFQLGSGQPTSIRSLLEKMGGIVGKDWPIKVEKAPRRQGEVLNTYCDISKAYRMLGYKPKVPLDAGLRRTWQWFVGDQHGCRAG